MCDCLKAEIWGNNPASGGIWGTIIDSICKPVSLYPFLFSDASSIFWHSSISDLVKIGIRFFCALSTLYFKHNLSISI